MIGDGREEDATASPRQLFFDALQRSAQKAAEWVGGLKGPCRLCCEFMPSHQELKNRKITLDLELPEG